MTTRDIDAMIFRITVAVFVIVAFSFWLGFLIGRVG